MTSIAFFGGSFDPPHVGHTLAVSWALSTCDISSVLVVPALDHAFDKRMTDFTHRRRMTELAFARQRGVVVSDLEARLGGASYTVRTLERLRAERPDVRWRLMIGADLVPQLPHWKEGKRLTELAPPLVIGRGGYPGHEESLAMPEVSSTEIRRRVAAGEAIEHLVPREVVAYIRAHGLYRT